MTLRNEAHIRLYSWACDFPLPEKCKNIMKFEM